nr:carboxypeptidase regulatory-like domain-containing protein [Acidobacteriota bacterium]
MKKILNLFLILVFVGLFISTATAQNPTGSIEGNVTDPSNSIVSGATVTITGATTGQTFTATTSEDGFFAVRSLQPGIYSIRVEQPGFSAATAENIVVQVGQVARADIGLKVGAPSETVEVDIGATDIQVDTTRQTVDGVITGRQITALPLNARNFLDLAVLQPGVTVVDGGVIDPTKTNAYRAVRVNGGSGTGTRVQ